MDSQRRSRLTATLVVAAAVVVVALVVALIVVLVSGGDDESGRTAAPPPSQAPSAAPEPRAEGGGETVDVDLVGRPVTVVDSTGGTPREQTGEHGEFPSGPEMVGPPEGLELQRVSSGTTLMVSRSDGPTDVNGGVMTGYTRSPGGAALVAANFMGLGLEMGPAYADFVEYFMPEMAAEDPAFIDDIRQRGESVNGRALTAAQGYSAPRWFRFEHCDETFCTVEMATPSLRESVGEIESPDPEVGIDDHEVLRVSMKWADSQWQIVSSRALPPVTEIDGSWSPWT